MSSIVFMLIGAGYGIDYVLSGGSNKIALLIAVNMYVMSRICSMEETIKSIKP